METVEDGFTYQEWAASTAPKYELTEEQNSELLALYKPVADYMLANNIPGNFVYAARQEPMGLSTLGGVSTAIDIAHYTTELLAIFLLANGGMANLDAHYDALLDAHNERVRKNAPRIVTNY